MGEKQYTYIQKRYPLLEYGGTKLYQKQATAIEEKRKREKNKSALIPWVEEELKTGPTDWWERKEKERMQEFKGDTDRYSGISVRKRKK